MPNCESCGAGIDASDSECPYCGASARKSTTVHRSDLERPEKVYTAASDVEGNTHIRFGDGQTGQRPSSGSDSVSSTYHYGAGAQGIISAGQLDERLDRVSRKLERIPDPSKHKGSRDEGVALLDYFSELSDLLSVYQSSVSHEAHLSTDDRDRLSKKEERIRPKMKSMVAFCDKVDSKTKKKMGLSDSDIHKIRTTATRALQLTESRSGKCVRCGTMNRPGTRKCQNCGAHL